jgi:hypothetical protein
VPFAGPVSFFGFMLLGPAVLIVLRVYLQIYVEHKKDVQAVRELSDFRTRSSRASYGSLEPWNPTRRIRCQQTVWSRRWWPISLFEKKPNNFNVLC